MVLNKEDRWTDDQWDKLESYLVEFGNLNTNNDYLYKFQLEFLSRYLNSNEQSIINHLNQLTQNKPGISKNDFTWEGNKTKLINEVDNIILSLNLAPFKEPSQPEAVNKDQNPTTRQKVLDRTKHQLEAHGKQHDYHQSHKNVSNYLQRSNGRPNGPISQSLGKELFPSGSNQEQNIDQVLSQQSGPEAGQREPAQRETRPESSNAVATSPSIQIEKSRIEMPKLSKAQRRTSLDLMYSRPHLANNITPRRSNSLSKPAIASISNVNVLTKADVSNKKEPSKKFNLVLIIPKRNGHAAVPVSGDHRSNNNLVVTADSNSRIPVDPPGELGQSGPSASGPSQSNPNTVQSERNNQKITNDKRTRRISLVGENLPSYIRNQLQPGGSHQDKTLTKKQSRMHNVLANSESLYAHNKDVPSVKSDSYTGTSDYDNINDQNSESEEDREYILPDLLTKYYEMQEEEEYDEDEDGDGDRIVDGMGNGMDNGFVNVDTQVDLSEDDEDEDSNKATNDGDDDKNQDDDYLFTV